MVLLLHTFSHSPPILYLLTQEWLRFPSSAMPDGICQLSQRLWCPWQSSRCLCAVMMEDEDLSPSCWWASGRPLKSLRCQVVAEWRGECWGHGKRHGAPLVQELQLVSRPHLKTFNVYLDIFYNNTLNEYACYIHVTPRRTTSSEPVPLKRPESRQHSSHVLVYLSTQDQSSHWLLKWAN